MNLRGPHGGGKNVDSCPQTVWTGAISRQRQFGRKDARADSIALFNWRRAYSLKARRVNGGSDTGQNAVVSTSAGDRGKVHNGNALSLSRSIASMRENGTGPQVWSATTGFLRQYSRRRSCESGQDATLPPNHPQQDRRTRRVQFSPRKPRSPSSVGEARLGALRTSPRVLEEEANRRSASEESSKLHSASSSRTVTSTPELGFGTGPRECVGLLFTHGSSYTSQRAPVDAYHNLDGRTEEEPRRSLVRVSYSPCGFRIPGLESSGPTLRILTAGQDAREECYKNATILDASSQPQCDVRGGRRRQSISLADSPLRRDPTRSFRYYPLVLSARKPTDPWRVATATQDRSTISHLEGSPPASRPDEPEDSRHRPGKWCQCKQHQTELEGANRSTGPDKDHNLHKQTDKHKSECNRNPMTLPRCILGSRVNWPTRPRPIPSRPHAAPFSVGCTRRACGEMRSQLLPRSCQPLQRALAAKHPQRLKQSW